jgi:FolB domain-containing protein
MWTAGGTCWGRGVDKIIIRDLSLRAIIGVNPDERKNRQDIIINVILSADLKPAGTSDNFKKTIDYTTIKKAILSHVETSKYFLIEALAENIARLCLAHPGVREATITVDKPGALRFARSVAVEITRKHRKKA